MLFSLFNTLQAQCTYQLRLNDSYGDGWNGNTIDVRVGATTTNYTLYYGNDTTINLSVVTGDTIQLTYNATGSYQNEVSFDLFDPNFTTVYASGTSPAANMHVDTTASCPSCMAPGSVALSSSSSSSLTLTWSSTGGQSNVEYGAAGFTQGSGTFLYNQTGTTTISSLALATDYDVYVQDSCGPGNTSAWSGPHTFTTQQNTVTGLPYTEDFESTNGGWITGGSNSSWQWGQPNTTDIDTAGNGLNAWVTNLTGNYNNSESSYIQSPIIDASSTSNDLYYAFLGTYETESCCDEGWVEYSFDGTTWTKLVNGGVAQNWYNDLGNQWWDGTDLSWTTRFNVIPGSAGQSHVQVRHRFGSDGSVVRDGFGVDSIYMAELACSISNSLGDSNTLAFSTDLYWSSTGSMFNVEVGAQGFTPGAGQGASYFTTNTYLSLTGLPDDSCMQFYVQDSCAAGNSIWVGPYNFCTLEACPDPTNAVLDSVTASDIYISWDNVVSAGSYTIEWGPCGFMQGTGTFVTVSSNDTVISGLSASQCVDVYIQSNCSNNSLGMSNWVGPFQFYTAQPTISSFPFIADFEANGGFLLPTGNNSDWEWGTPGGTVIASASSGSKAWVTNLDGDYSNSQLSYLTTAIFDLSGYTDDFIFYFDQIRDLENCCDEFWLEMSTNGTSWTKVTNNGSASNWYNDANNQWWDSDQTTWTQSSIIFDTLDNKSYVQFRFVMSSDGSVTDEGIGVDNLGFAALTCGVPSGISGTAISADSISVAWTTSSGYSNIEYGVAGFTQGSGTLITGATGNDTIFGLTSGTTYDIYIQDSCGVGNLGLWIGPLQVSTLQGVVNTFPYNEGFETSAGGWLASGTNGSWEWGVPAGTVIGTASEGVNAWVTNLDGTYNNSELSYLTSLIFDCSSFTNDAYYSFDMIYETESCCDEGWVEYSFDGTTWTKLVDNGSAVQWYNDLGNLWWDGTGTSAWDARYNVIPGSAGQAHVQVRHVFSSDFSVIREGFGVDDVEFNELPCSISTNLGATNITTGDADIFWNSPGTLWNVEWGPTGFVQGTTVGTVITVSNDTVNLSGLAASTCYDFYVQDTCAAGNSVWVGPFTFCTQATCPAPTNLNVTNLTSTSTTLEWDGNNVPGSYIVEYGLSTTAFGFGTRANAAGDSLPVTGLMAATNYCFYVAEVCSPTDTSAWSGPYCFTTACSSNAGDYFQVAIPYTGAFVDTGNLGVCFTDSLSLRGTPRGPEVVYEYTPSVGTIDASFYTCGSAFDTYLYIVAADQTTIINSNDDNFSVCGTRASIENEIVVPGQTYYIVVETYSTSTTPGMYVLEVVETNPCPAPSNLMFDATTCSSVDLIWTNSGSASSFQIEYGAAGFTPGSGTNTYTTDTTETISGLSVNTAYDFYVRGFCASGDTSGWISFTGSTDSVSSNAIVGNYTITSVTLTDAGVDFDATGTVADSVSWDFDDAGATASGMTASHIYTANGTYNVVLYAYTDCGVDSIEIEVIISTISLSEYTEANFRVYPNPTDGMVNVEFDQPEKDALIELVTLQGQVINTILVEANAGTREVQMDLSNLPAGVYTIRYSTSRGSSVQRVVLH